MQGYSGLRAQDLQEAKDQLLVETSDMLHVPLFTAEALLRNYGMVLYLMLIASNSGCDLDAVLYTGGV